MGAEQTLVGDVRVEVDVLLEFDMIEQNVKASSY